MPVPAPPTSTTVGATWRGGRRYDIARPGGPTTTIDGAGEAGTGPVDTLLGALAACAAIDVEDYLVKRRTPPERLTVTVRAERRAELPRRIMSAHLEFAIDGAGVEPAHAARAVALAVDRYCSVAASLAADIVIGRSMIVNGVPVSPSVEAQSE
ncbi:MAG: OsmC family protein [Gemmatimonadaceae bacterium]|nr:OsmC family protein [Gemmatimonadaceae bacterium]